jgi:hypothetical protein
LNKKTILKVISRAALYGNGNGVAAARMPLSLTARQFKKISRMAATRIAMKLI